MKGQACISIKEQGLTLNKGAVRVSRCPVARSQFPALDYRGHYRSEPCHGHWPSSFNRAAAGGALSEGSTASAVAKVVVKPSVVACCCCHSTTPGNHGGRVGGLRPGFELKREQPEIQIRAAFQPNDLARYQHLHLHQSMPGQPSVLARFKQLPDGRRFGPVQCGGRRVGPFGVAKSGSRRKPARPWRCF